MVTTATEINIPAPELVEIDELKTDQQNPNRMTPKQHAALADSMRRYGFIVPIITNKDLLIADGEQRWVVAKALGMNQVPVIRLPVEDVDRRLLRQVLNKLRGEHELTADAYEFERIIQMGHEDDLKTLLLLSDSQIERYLAMVKEPKAETYRVPEIEKVQTNIIRGELYQLGQHKLMCGDSTLLSDIELLLDGRIPNMGFHDPPYGVDYDKSEAYSDAYATDYGFKNYGKMPGDKNVETYLRFLKILAGWREMPTYLCTSDKYLKDVLCGLSEVGIYKASSLIIWVKESPVPSWDQYHAQHESIIFCGEAAKPRCSKTIWYGPKNETTIWQINRDQTTKGRLERMARSGI